MFKQLRVDGDYDVIMKTESKIQQEIVMWFRNEYSRNLSPKPLIFSIPNERSNVKEQSRMIATGLLSGVSDLIVLLPNKTLFVEVKDEKGTQKPKQKEFEQNATSLGFKYYLVRDLETFKNIIHENR